ncbi:queuosine biosynthesis QueC ATPase [Sulfuriferula multivorans]|uniref:7-cyano-7-deazaguanine synthase n=2 Tax=Sulfuriferula multivorans TaxID=1559896 RepID=A0A401JFD5_9PROT|nr:queuosine biosynthesis QueC ATPase [Sulfuriferula multivorans]
MMDKTRRAVILLSGGLDSATVLAIARSSGFACHALSFDYGQRHSAELDAAARVAARQGAVEHRVFKLDLAMFGGSALTDSRIAVPEQASTGIPVTYVPARNTIMLSIALAWAEVLESRDIFIGVNAVDYSGYPDCRPEYIASFETMANLATKAGVEGKQLHVHTPLMQLGKAQIIRLGTELGVDYNATVSCYQADAAGRACGVCDSCRLRRQGFIEAGVADATRYVASPE